MKEIEVDFDVWRELTALRRSEADTYSDVIRRLIDGGSSRTVVRTGKDGKAWHPKGVRIPEGTHFRTTYQGEEHTGRVEGGALVVNGERFSSPSAAGSSITGYPVNGWTFWKCRLPDEDRWVLMDALRER